MPKLFINFSSTAELDELNYGVKIAIRRAIAATLAYEGAEYDAELSVTFCDNKYIQKLNREYREKDKPTDVLSFPMYEAYELEGVDSTTPVMLGDIVISVERTKAQAAELGNTFLYEISFLAIHSTLHLLGYDHELGKDEEEAQCLAQREIISTLSIK